MSAVSGNTSGQAAWTSRVLSRLETHLSYATQSYLVGELGVSVHVGPANATSGQY